MTCFRLIAALLLAAPTLGSPASRAQPSEPRSQSYINPFPEGDTYRAVMIGDWLAEGLVGSFADTLQGDQRIQVQRKVRILAGLSKPEWEDEVRAIEEQIARETLHIAVVFVGGGDRLSYRAANGKRIPVGSEEWRAEYGRRVDRLMKALKKRNIAAYWVGQPILRRSEADDDAQVMNEVMREKANLNGLRYIDIHAGFADDGGGYNSWGPDLAGKSRVLRSSDGIGFTADGYRKLAHFVERDVKRDVTQAKSDRNIPLAGAEADQRKINPNKVVGGAQPPVASAPQAGMASRGSRGATNWITTTAQAPQLAGSPSGAGEQRAENGKVTLKTLTAGGRDELVTLDILRPAIPATVLALVTRRETAEKASQMGETMTASVPGGVLVLSSVTPPLDGSGRRGRQNATQTSYYRVLVKGDRIPSKPGRADDHVWPRQDTVAEVPPAALAPKQPAASPAAKGTPAKGQPRG